MNSPMTEHYRYLRTVEDGSSGTFTVIEKPDLVIKDPNGNDVPSYRFIDSHTVHAHPLIFDKLIEDSERIWTLSDVLSVLLPHDLP